MSSSIVHHTRLHTGDDFVRDGFVMDSEGDCSVIKQKQKSEEEDDHSSPWAMVSD